VGRLATAVILAVLALPGAAQGAISFSTTPYPLPHVGNAFASALGAVKVVDLNNDNHPDIVVTRGGSGVVYVLVNQGNGTFAAAQPYASCSNTDDGGKMVTGQFDAGQNADLIVSCDTVSVERLLGNGDGTFPPGTSFATPGGPIGLALWPAGGGASARLLYGNYCSSCTPPADALCYQPISALGTGDCPADDSLLDMQGGPNGHAGVGQATIVTAHLYTTSCAPFDDVILSIFNNEIRGWGLNTADPPGPTIACGSFSYASHVVNASPAVNDLTQLSAADLDGNGSPDLLMTDTPANPSAPARLVSLLWQGGSTVSGGFPPTEVATPTASIAGIDDQKVADFDGDGHMDAAVAGSNGSETAGTLAIQRGHGEGSFDSPPLTFDIPGGNSAPSTNHLAVGDLNGDNKPDVVSIARDKDSVTVLLNTTGASPPQRTLTVTTSGTGSGTVTGAGIDCGGAGHSDCSETVAQGATITLAASAASGSAFGGFSGGGCGATTPCTVTLDSDQSVAATFTANPAPPAQRTLTVTTSGLGTGTVTGAGIDCGGALHVDCSETVAQGATITLAASAASGSTFGGFSGGGCGATTPCTVTLDADKSVGASFALAGVPSDPPGVPALVCPVLRNLRGQVAATFATLIAQFPAVKAALAAARAVALAQIDSALAKLGCVPAAKVRSAAAARAPQVGTARGDRLNGSARDDLQFGRGGKDRLLGRGGRDVMLGESGADRLDGGPGADLMSGGAGNDAINGRSGADLILGGAGKDTINARDGARDYVACGAGRDRVTADRRDVLAKDCERVSRR
jgi:hypothetical protein